MAHDQTPGQTRAALDWAVPDNPTNDYQLFANLRELLFERSTQTGHGGWMAYISGSGTIPGDPASLLAAGEARRRWSTS
ncbi:MAG TPA: hypothetical protein VE569_00155 [Acidimicrobiia bacterium]|nr:hypothetical protein [Acidimicrobiia bacterium]